MCFGQVFENMPTPQEEGNDALGEVVEIICSSPGREEIRPLVIHTERDGVRCLTIDCGKLSMVWKVEMMQNCRFRRLSLYRRFCRPIRKGTRTSKTFLMPVKIWEGPMCSQIIRLHRLGQLRDLWWNFSILPNPVYRDVLNKRLRESRSGDQGGGSGPAQAEHSSSENCDSMTDVSSPDPRPESPLRLKHKKMRLGARIRPMMRTMTKTMFSRTLYELMYKGRLRIMRKVRMRTMMALRKRSTRVANMLRKVEV
ncbi:hypothetical protein C7212DRAFT_348948 [Tuber magnatum]|uniref:Uncharacterized protein n=1 Tax=Tuber magnatum TaxID=42249 RepID=A0A317SAN6_9PEZI|nr:hypothetical protein C7212DRAFT_348948 [Tuber magnatum]